MAVHPLIILALVNMHRRNAVMHVLLNSDLCTNLFLIQKLWFDTISTVYKNTAYQGVDVLEGVAFPGWEVIYPSIPEGQRPKIMAYTRAYNSAPNHIILSHARLKSDENETLARHVYELYLNLSYRSYLILIKYLIFPQNLECG